MIDFDRILESVPHYIAILILIFLVLYGVRQIAGALDFWIELLIVLAVAFAYPPLVRQLGIAPSAWRRTED